MLAVLLSNLFILWSRVFGVASTVRFIKLLARSLPFHDASLDVDSARIERCYKRFRYLFIARRQKCLIRGFLLYFYGKRARRDVRLIFGAAPLENPDSRVDLASPKWHCWITEAHQLKFEVSEVIGQYTPFLEFA